jgi:reverse gyrase
LSLLSRFLTRGRLQRAEREAKRLHGLQKRLRTKLDDLEQERKKKGLPEAAYQERKARIDHERHALLDKLKEVEERERHLRAELHALEAPNKARA